MARSKIVDTMPVDPEPGRYSHLQVLRSAAGYYIGTLWHGDGYTEPGSRDSEYFATEPEAQKILDYIDATGDRDFLRDHA